MLLFLKLFRATQLISTLWSASYIPNSGITLIHNTVSTVKNLHIACNVLFFEIDIEYINICNIAVMYRGTYKMCIFICLFIHIFL